MLSTAACALQACAVSSGNARLACVVTCVRVKAQVQGPNSARPSAGPGRGGIPERAHRAEREGGRGRGEHPTQPVVPAHHEQ